MIRLPPSPTSTGLLQVHPHKSNCFSPMLQPPSRTTQTLVLPIKVHSAVTAPPGPPPGAYASAWHAPLQTSPSSDPPCTWFEQVQLLGEASNASGVQGRGVPGQPDLLQASTRGSGHALPPLVGGLTTTKSVVVKPLPPGEVALQGLGLCQSTPQLYLPVCRQNSAYTQHHAWCQQSCAT